MASSHLDPTVWQDVFSPMRREAEDLQILQQQFQSWCAAHHLEAAALYSRSKRHLSYGEACSPAEIIDGANAPEGWITLALPEGRLLYRGETLMSDDPELLLLSAGIHISALKQQVHQQSFQANFRGVELEALYDVGLAIARTLDFEQLCEEILVRAIALLDARRGALYLLEGDLYRLTRSVGGEARKEITAHTSDAEALSGILSAEQSPAGWLPGAEFILSVPIEIEGSRRGLLAVADKESRTGVGPFRAEDRRTLSLFANQAAIALENAKLHQLALDKERLEREMELAAEIQQQILPKAMPDIPGFEAIGWNRPARQVGGDYFDLWHLENGHWGLVVADVTGKGMPAALLVSTLHSALRLLLDRVDVGPELTERLNRHIFESSSSNKFITMLLAALDTSTNRLSYINAGHNPGLLLRKNGEVEHLSSAGMPLGLMPHGTYSAAQLELESGDLVCIYSDGITECQAPDEEELGLDRLVELLHEHSDLPLGEILKKIDTKTIDFAQGRPQGDDQTVVLLRRR